MSGAAKLPGPEKSFLITIDTEGDNLWARTPDPGTKNAAFLPRFQALCERYGFKPVYLTDYQMARDAAFGEFAADVLRRQTGEIGMHLHAWSTPGGAPLTAQDHVGHPYLINFPEAAMREKIKIMTELLAEKFGVAPVSHRAGRWAMDERYAALLVEHGYRVDCSVTPHVLWPALPSFDGRPRGADYRGFPLAAYGMAPGNIKRSQRGGLLQVPMTIRVCRRRWDDAIRPWLAPFVGPGRWPHLSVRTEWLRPNGRNGAGMIALLTERAQSGDDHAEFMLHSSEFMPGGSPAFPDAASIEQLYADMDALFRCAIQLGYRGATLAEYQKGVAGKPGTKAN